MTFLDAAKQVLKEATTPLHYSQVTSQALARGMLTTSGLTPAATMGSRLYIASKEPNTWVKNDGGGYFSAAEQREEGIAQQIKVLNVQTRLRLKSLLFEMPPEEFEVLVLELLSAMGFDKESLENRQKEYGGSETAPPVFVRLPNRLADKLANVGGRRPLGPIHDAEFDLLTLDKGAEAVHLDCGLVDENILATIDLKKAEAFLIVEPLDGAGY